MRAVPKEATLHRTCSAAMAKGLDAGPCPGAGRPKVTAAVGPVNDGLSPVLASSSFNSKLAPNIRFELEDPIFALELCTLVSQYQANKVHALSGPQHTERMCEPDNAWTFLALYCNASTQSFSLKGGFLQCHPGVWNKLAVERPEGRAGQHRGAQCSPGPCELRVRTGRQAGWRRVVSLYGGHGQGPDRLTSNVAR